MHFVCASLRGVFVFLCHLFLQIWWVPVSRVGPRGWKNAVGDQVFEIRNSSASADSGAAWNQNELLREVLGACFVRAGACVAVFARPVRLIRHAQNSNFVFLISVGVLNPNVLLRVVLGVRFLASGRVRGCFCSASAYD